MLILYGINLSTFTRKVRLALAEKALDYRLEIAPMGSPKVRALHPLGKIPVLEDAGFAIPDSSVSIAYLERVYPAWPKLARYLQALLVRPKWVPIVAEEEVALQSARARRSAATG